MTRRRKPTATSNFGAGRRESHDASPFYERFAIPEISTDGVVNETADEFLDRIYRKDARRMDDIQSSSVALVVTSPPYFTGKEYEQALGRGHIPGSYIEYLEMLTDVFRECSRVLEPGGRMAVNVANLGRKPFRSLASDVIDILQNRLGLLLRGEIVWQKGVGAAGSCAWGSFQSPANPVLRDLTERIVVACKERFDRAVSRVERRRRQLPHEPSITKDDFMDATLDVWEMAPESATRVGHPAPFPVELPTRLIHLYTYRGDVILDPFMGSGTTAVAAVQTGRRYVGYELDSGYIAVAEERIGLAMNGGGPSEWSPSDHADSVVDSAISAGRRADEVVHALLLEAGFAHIAEDVRLGAGIEADFEAVDHAGARWLFLVAGGLTTTRSGLRRAETLWRVLGHASVIRSCTKGEYRLVVFTTDLPPKGSAPDAALNAVLGNTIHDVVNLRSSSDRARFRARKP